MKYNITHKNILNFNKSFNKKRTNKIFKNVNTKRQFSDLVIESDYVQKDHTKFSNIIDVKTKITEQGNSGTCWIFSILNIMRINMIRDYNLTEFEFSENYLFFYDRLEKANFFLNYIINNYNKDIDNDAKLINMLIAKTNDGNHWSMFYNLIKKYGIIPKSAMSDHFHSKNSEEMNDFLNNYLIQVSEKIIETLKKKNNTKNQRALITNALNECYKILVIFLGEPPKTFDWSYIIIKKKDSLEYKSNEQIITYNNLTPLIFYNKFVKNNVDRKICLINYPCKNVPFFKKYRIELTPDVIGGKEPSVINVPQSVIFKAIKKSIDDKNAVWCGIDWNKFNANKYGILDTKAFNYNDIFDNDNIMSKCSGLKYRQSHPNHAVIIRGYNINNGKIDKFLVENSHGDNNIFNGFISMSVEWFNLYLYEIVVDKKYIDTNIIDINKYKTIILPYNSPFGSLFK